MSFQVRTFTANTSPLSILTTEHFTNELDAHEAYHDRTNAARASGVGVELIGPDGRMASTVPGVQRTPAECLTALIEHDGHRYSLCCVRHHYSGEGDAILEQLSLDNKPDGEPAFTDFQAFGRWYVKSTDEGPSTFRVEFDSVADLDDSVAVINKLLSDLGEAPWGVDLVEVYS